MAKKEPAAIRRHVGTLFRIGTTGGMTDGQLLKRFVLRDGEPADLAFAALVERHGPMVLRVCRALLRDEHEAQDAVQATFLILVLRADSIRKQESAASWLHGVARRVASCARAASARRRVHERRAAERMEPFVNANNWDDLGEVVHEELARLPLPHREALVVCDLEGLSEGQAAERLDWPIGTVRSRLARGRDRLRRRLVRRGLAPAVGLIAAVSTPGTTSAAMPGALLEATLQAARGLAVGSISGSVISSSVEVLTRKVLKNMQLAQWKIPAALVFGLGAFTTVAACLAARPAADEPPQDELPAASKPAPPRAEDAPGNAGALKNIVEARGMLQPSHTTDVVNEVEGMTTILSLVPEGTVVKKGQVVCRLDSASLKDELIVQGLAEKEAVAAYENAKLAHEVAEIALAEYAEGISKRELKAVHGEIAGSKLAIQKAEERLERTRRTRQRLNEVLNTKGASRTPADLLVELDVDDRIGAAELTLDRERRLLEKAVADHAVIEKYTRPKTIKALSVDVEQARSIELTKEAARMLAGSKKEKLERQIEKCTVVAPSDGVIRYPFAPGRINDKNSRTIEEGATLRERQRIFSVLNMSEPLYVNIEVPESAIARVKPGQKARIKVDAFPNETLDGVVKQVAPMVIPGGTSYLTTILIDHGSPKLRPNMTAGVEILVDAPEETRQSQAPDALAPKSSDSSEKPERH